MPRLSKYVMENLINLASSKIAEESKLVLDPLIRERADLIINLQHKYRDSLLNDATISGMPPYMSVNISKKSKTMFQKVYERESLVINKKIEKIASKKRNIIVEFKRQLIMGENDGKKLPKYK